MSTGRFSQKSSIISGSLAENDLQFRASYGLLPPCMNVPFYTSDFVLEDIYIYAFTCMHMRKDIYMHSHTCIHVYVFVCVFVCLCVCMCVCVCVCVCVYVYILCAHVYE